MMMNQKLSPKTHLFQYALTGLLLPCLLLFSHTVQDAIPSKVEATNFILLINPDLSPELQEKLQKEQLPFGKKLTLVKNNTGRIIGVTMTNATGGSCSASYHADYELPIVLYGYENAVSVHGFNDYLLDHLIRPIFPKSIKLITYGISLDPENLETYRAKIAKQEALENKFRPGVLRENEWLEMEIQGSTTYQIPVEPDSWKSLKQRIETTYIDPNKSYHIVLNGTIIEPGMPEIDLAKIKKMTLLEGIKTEYAAGAIKFKKRVQTALRLEIETE